MYVGLYSYIYVHMNLRIGSNAGIGLHFFRLSFFFRLLSGSLDWCFQELSNVSTNRVALDLPALKITKGSSPADVRLFSKAMLAWVCRVLRSYTCTTPMSAFSRRLCLHGYVVFWGVILVQHRCPPFFEGYACMGMSCFEELYLYNTDVRLFSKAMLAWVCRVLRSYTCTTPMSAFSRRLCLHGYVVFWGVILVQHLCPPFLEGYTCMGMSCFEELYLYNTNDAKQINWTGHPTCKWNCFNIKSCRFLYWGTITSTTHSERTLRHLQISAIIL